MKNGVWNLSFSDSLFFYTEMNEKHDKIKRKGINNAIQSSSPSLGPLANAK